MGYEIEVSTDESRFAQNGGRTPRTTTSKHFDDSAHDVIATTAHGTRQRFEILTKIDRSLARYITNRTLTE
jgi:hypothetical protein